MTEKKEVPKFLSPSKAVKTRISKILTGIRKGKSNGVSASMAGVSERSFYVWMDQARKIDKWLNIDGEYPEDYEANDNYKKLTDPQKQILRLMHRLENAKDYAESKVTDKLMGLVDDGDRQAIEFWLKCRRSKRWNPTQNIKQTSVKKVITFTKEDLDNMEDDELDEAIKMMSELDV